MFGDLARLFSGQGPVNWDISRQTAVWLATEGQAEPNVEPLERMRMEELVRVADLRVTGATGLSTSVAGGILTVLPVTRAQWALNTLDVVRPYIQRLAESLSEASGPAATVPDPNTQLLGDLGRLLGPVLLGMQSGYMLGHLARSCLGQYDLALPRMPADQILVVPANLAALAEQWSLDAEDLRLWVCFREITDHALLGLPHVRARLVQLVDEYVNGFDVDPDALEAGLGDIDPTDPAGLQAVLGNPETLLGAVRSEAQIQVLVRLQTLLAAIEGYVDHVLDTSASSLIGAYSMITEALRRQRNEGSEGSRFAARLLGLEMGRDQYELAGLWESERTLPTPPELDAPGLWLARIELPQD